MVVADLRKIVVSYQKVYILNSDYDVECECEMKDIPKKFLIHKIADIEVQDNVLMIRCEDL
jgi:hypothetical protein